MPEATLHPYFEHKLLEPHQFMGPAPVGGSSCAARRNSTADPANSEAKNPFRITTGHGQTGAPAPHPAPSATTAITTRASAAPFIASAIPFGRKRATMAPTAPMASTPAYKRLAGLFSLPMMPTAPFSHTRRNATTSAMPLAAR